MAKKQDKPWQYKFSFALSLVMLALVLGYFVQSFLEIRKVQPVRVAIERIGESRAGESPGPVQAVAVQEAGGSSSDETLKPEEGEAK